MTDTDASTAAPVGLDFSDYLVKEAARNRLAAELRPANKAALFDALASVGIVSVIVTFDGYGDSGQIESIDARDAHGDVALPEGQIELASPTYDSAEVERRTLTVRDAIEQLAYDLLEETYAGWENNDGAYGEFAFEVAERTITLDYNGRYTAVESYSHEW